MLVPRVEILVKRRSAPEMSVADCTWHTAAVLVGGRATNAVWALSGAVG